MEAGSFRGANADTSHYLLIAGLRGRIDRMTDRTVKTCSKYDNDRLKRPEVKPKLLPKYILFVP